MAVLQEDPVTISTLFFQFIDSELLHTLSHRNRDKFTVGDGFSEFTSGFQDQWDGIYTWEENEEQGVGFGGFSVSLVDVEGSGVDVTVAKSFSDVVS